jgi:hypothetical protein
LTKPGRLDLLPVYQVLDHKEALAAISNEAVQVAALEELLAQVAEK